jgi:hypothetical protein
MILMWTSRRQVMTSHRPRRPRFPFFKDETTFGEHITLRTSLRALILAIMLGAVVLGAVIWWAVVKVNELDNLTSQRHSDTIAEQKREAAIIAQNRSDAFQQVAQLACGFAAIIPSGQSAYVDSIRVTYGCPPYGSKATGPVVAPTPTAQPTGTFGAPNGHATSGATPTSLPSPTKTGSPVPSATTTRTVTVKPTPSSAVALTPPLLNLPSATCVLLGVLCP